MQTRRSSSIADPQSWILSVAMGSAMLVRRTLVGHSGNAKTAALIHPYRVRLDGPRLDSECRAVGLVPASIE